MRKRCRRRVFVPLPPRGLRPKLKRDQVIDLGLAHWQNIDQVAKGQGDETLLWQLVECTFTWSRVADMLGIGIDEMRAQLELVTRMVERYGRTGRVAYTGVEYQLAKVGCDVMDALAETVDEPTAVAACAWSEAQVDALVARQQGVRLERCD